MKDLIDWEKIDFKNKTSGEVDTICPNCSHERKASNQKKPCLRVNLDKGVGKCHHCEAITVKKREQEKVYETPNQDWQNFTNMDKEVVQWFKTRGISQNNLLVNRVTQELIYNPIHQKKLRHIAFNYFEGETLTSKKFRSADKKFTQTKNCKKMFYGINDVIGETEAYIVEGEMDKLAMYEIGVKNCISVPNGANDLNNIFDTCADYLKDLKKIYIAVDQDAPGEKLEKELLKRFGKWRCEKITFKGKDANDDLIDSPLTLQEAIDHPKPYPVDGLFSAKDVEDQILHNYRNGKEKTTVPDHESFRELNKIFSILPGQLTTVTGIPSHGKSNFIEWYVLNLVNDQDLKAVFYSPEHHPVADHHEVFMEKCMAKPFDREYNWNGDRVDRITEDEIKEYTEWSKDKIKLIENDSNEVVNWSWLLDKFKEAMFSFGADIFVVDAYNKVRRKNPDSLGEINQSLADLTAFAQGYGVHVILIAHPTKQNKDKDTGIAPQPNLYSVKGSGDFYDQTHNGLCVYRYWKDEENGIHEDRTDIINLKTKLRRQGQINESVSMQFDPANARYHIFGEQKDRTCLFKKTATKEITPTEEKYNINKTIESAREEGEDEWNIEPIDF